MSFISGFRAGRWIGIWAAVAAAGQGFAHASISALDSLPVEKALTPEVRQQQLEKWCADTRAITEKQFKWKVDPCKIGKDGIQWKVGGTSVSGHPLLFAEFGNPASPNKTLILSMVHGDEVTPLYVGIQMVAWLKEHLEGKTDVHVVLAPMVNPDGFFRRPRSRTNSRGVDVNRNFATTDWQNTALKTWKVKYRSDPRRYPGPAPRSEPETLFQEELIRRLKPQKILSIHSPLNHFDYDGPSTLSLSKFPNDYVEECLKLRKRLKAIHSGFYPGSLGNYAGKELGIPTVTLELPSADPRKADHYWQQFSKGMKTMIEYVMPNFEVVIR